MNNLFKKFLKTKISTSIVCAIVLISTISCSKVDPVTGESKIIEPDVQKRAREYADKGGGIFGDINNKKPGGSTSVDFATSNVLWRATLKSLDFLPLLNVDYAGGVIIYDWYSEDLNSKEQIKIFINFNSSELRTDSLNITVHKKICLTNENCKITRLSGSYDNEIKDSIITTARKIRIEEEKQKK